MRIITLLFLVLVCVGAHTAYCSNVAWTMVVLPDTQKYRTPATWAIFNQMTQWIVEEKESRRIQVVLHEGDITDNNTDTQWAEAYSAMSRLNGEVPYIIVGGNHDYPNLADRSTSKFNDYFHLEDNPLNNSPAGIYTTQRIPGKMDDVYGTFTAPDGRKMLIFGLQFIPNSSVSAWANSVAAQQQYQDYTAVILTHANMGEGPATPDGEPTPLRERVGDLLWNGIVRKHGNIEMVLNGHLLDGDDSNPNGPMTTARQVSTGVNGNTVHEIVFNTQQLPNGGNGFLRLMEFLDDGTTVQVRTYSPYLDSWLTGDRHEFQIQLSQIPILQGTPGDYNNDGIVDAADYTVWRNHLGETDETNLNGNGNGGDVSLDDYALWKLHYGTSALGAGGLPGLVQVPEPSVFAMVLIVAGGLLIHRRSQRA